MSFYRAFSLSVVLTSLVVSHGGTAQADNSSGFKLPPISRPLPSESRIDRGDGIPPVITPPWRYPEEGMEAEPVIEPTSPTEIIEDILEECFEIEIEPPAENCVKRLPIKRITLPHVLD
jgi:hypothetical protein